VTPDSVETHLELWPGLAGGRATLINLSENHTFRIDGVDRRRHILRVHRPGYQQAASIRSELNWIAALAAETDIVVSTALPGRNGDFIQTILGAPGDVDRQAVLFSFEEGQEPHEDGDLRWLFVKLGTLAAKCHAHADRWTPPPAFIRPRWTAEAILDSDGLWGDWRRAPNLDAASNAMIARLEQRLRHDLAAYGQDVDGFGLIHADMRLANLLVGGPRGIVLIDFDDAGYGWKMYDFGAAMSFMEDRADLPDLADAWLEGYRVVGPLEGRHTAMLGTMVMLRRLALLAWVGSHGETTLAQNLAPQFAPITADLAETYLLGNLGL
jgi:Ser/Thr protein kinase RdoA (MazF antagonist)